MIIHEGKHAIRITPVKDVPSLPRSLEQAAEAARLEQEVGERTDAAGFIRWWNDQARMREIPKAPLAPENLAIVKRLLYKHGDTILQGAALMVLNNFAEPLTKGYQHPMRYLAAKMPEALDLLARWEKRDGS